MSKDTFLFHVAWHDVLAEQPHEIMLEVYNGIIHYARTRQSPVLSPLGKLAFSFIKADMDKDFAKYDAMCERNRKNGNSGGRPKKNPVEPKKTSGFSGFISEKEKEEEKENISPTTPIKEKEKEKERGEQTGARKITCRERQLEFLSEINVRPEYLPLMEEWLEFKADRKQTYTSKRGVSICYNKLVALSNGDVAKAKAVIEQSMANNWAGLFELKQNNYNNGTSQTYKSNVQLKAERNTAIQQQVMQHLSDLANGRTSVETTEALLPF